MSDVFIPAFQIIVGEEGNLSVESSDRGNWTGGEVGVGDLRGTKYGWAAGFWKSNVAQMPADVQAQMPAWPDEMTLDQARLAYRSLQWAKIGGDAMPPPIALPLFDAAVNQGPERAAWFVQSAVHVVQDGDIGPLTLAAVAGVDPLNLLADVHWLRDCAYHAAAEWMTYGHGWIRRLAQITALSLVYDQPGALVRWLPHPGRMM